MKYEEYKSKNNRFTKRIIRKIKKMLLNKHDKISNHKIISTKKIGDNNFKLLERNIRIKIVKNGEDNGYHEYGNDWWFNYSCPYSYSYCDINNLYPEYYFGGNIAHPDIKIAENLYEYMQNIYSSITNNNFKSILEIGGGAGALTNVFYKNHLDFITIEGVKQGYHNLIRSGIPKEKLILADMRTISKLDRTFDIVMCTEVIEHIEPFFAGRVIEFLTKHSDFIWFSAADRNRPPHFHHMNEQAIEVWDNIFAFLGYNFFVELNGKYDRADRLYIKGANEKVKNIFNVL